MRTTQEALAMIKSFEKLRLQAYKCPAGFYTIGWGHTGRVEEGQTITVPQAEWYFQEDIEEAEACVNRLVTVPLSDNEFSALVSFVFNLGASRLSTSTLLRKLNCGNREEAAVEFLRWNHSNGEALPGLTRRREAEMRLFLKPDNQKGETL